MIRFNGNGEAHEFLEVEDLAVYNMLGLHVVTFNYRGVGKSAFSSSFFGSLASLLRTDTRDGLIMDGDAVVQYVHRQLGVPIDHLLLLGHSLGGAVATEVAMNYPGISICNSRSFGLLSSVVRAMAADVFTAR